MLLKISKKKPSQPCEGQSSELSNKKLKPLHDATDVENVSEVHQLKSDSVVAGKEDDVKISEEGQVNLCADIVAWVSEAYHFDG